MSSHLSNSLGQVASLVQILSGYPARMLIDGLARACGYILLNRKRGCMIRVSVVNSVVADFFPLFMSLIMACMS